MKTTTHHPTKNKPRPPMLRHQTLRFTPLAQRRLLPVETLGLQPAPLPQHRGPTPHALAEQQRRILALNKFRLYTDAGYTKARAAQLAGAGYTTVWRWQKLQATGGDDALLPRQHLSGRRSEFTLRESALGQVEAAVLKLGSRRAGFLQFARSAACPADLARKIRPRTRHVPQSLLNKIPLRRVSATLLVGPTQFAITLRTNHK